MRKGFIASLFYLSFRSLVATRLIRIIYLLTIVLIGIVALLVIAIGFEISPLAGFACVVLIAPVGAFASLVYARVGLEFTIALLRIMENTGELVRLGSATPAAAAANGHADPAAVPFDHVA